MSQLCAYVVQNNLAGVREIIKSCSSSPVHSELSSTSSPTSHSVLDEVADISNQKFSPLYLAFHLDFTDIAVELLQAGASLTHSEDLPPPMVLAIAHKNKSLVTLTATLHPSTLTVPYRTYSSPLATATYAGELELVKVLLGCGASASTPALTTASDSNASTLLSPLRAAVQGDCSQDDIGELIETLVGFGADVNEVDSTGSSLLLTSVRFDRCEALYHLLRLGADPTIANAQGVTPAVLAVHRASSSIAALETILTECKGLVNEEGRTQGSQASLLHYAVLLGEPLPVRCLIAHGADKDFVGATPNSTKLTPLATAIQQRNPAMVQLLLESGANVDARILDGLLTPLTYIAAHFSASSATEMEQQDKSFEIVKLLIKHGADVNARVESLEQPQRSVKRTPLHFACEKGSLELVQILIDAGADVSALDTNRISPLSDAVKGGFVSIVKLLLQKNSRVSHRHVDGSNVFDYAKLIKNSVIEQMLEKAVENNPF